MNENVKSKIFEMIEKDVNGFSAKLNERDVLKIRYDSSTNLYDVELITKSEKMGFDSTERKGLEMIEIGKILDNPKHLEVFNEIYEKRLEKEELYEKTKERLLAELEDVDVPTKTKMVMKSIIERVSQLEERVGFKGNHVPIQTDPFMRESLSLMGREGEEFLHLQITQVIEHPISGMDMRDYPEASFEQIVKYIDEKGIKIEDIEKDKTK